MPLIHACDYTAKLWNLLGRSRRHNEVSHEFFMTKENSERVRVWLKLFEEFDVTIKGKLKSEKSNIISELGRTKGNKFYEKSQFLDALSSYNESLCFAESGSKNIALAYANRSAVYCEMKLYEKCLKNIELAKKYQYPNLDKLKQREETCKEMMISNKSNLSPTNVPIGENYLKLSHPANKKLPFVADCLELKTNKEFGRHIITKTALQPGDVVCCEEPFIKFLEPSHQFKYCATCFNDNFLDLFPCNTCTSTMFCSEECATIGQEKFHKFECPIIDKLNGMCTRYWRMAFRVFVEALYICDGNLQDLKALIEENQNSSMTVFDYEFPLEAKSFLNVIDALSTNESKRVLGDLFQRTGVVAIISDLFVKHTKLREILVTRDDEDFFYSFVFKHCQIADVNCHGLQSPIEIKSEVKSTPQYGSGIFPFCSLLNHSCAPNLIRVTSNCKSYVVVIRPIPAGGQLFDNYEFHHCSTTVQQRQIQLMDHYNFKCLCEACKGNYPVVVGLKHSDPRFREFSSKDDFKLAPFSFDLAVKKFKSNGDYLKRMDRNYTSFETMYNQASFVRCIRIFATSEFKLKLCEQ